MTAVVQFDEREQFDSFSRYYKAASYVCKNNDKRLDLADAVFKRKYGFSLIQPFREVYAEITNKKVIEFESGTEVVKRHQVKGEKNSSGLNKGIPPEGFMNKKELSAYLKSNYFCPASLSQLILQIYEDEISKDEYASEISLHDEVHRIDVPCFKVSDVLYVLDTLCQKAFQKRTKRKEVSVMCHIPELNRNFRFDLDHYKKVRFND